MNRLRTTMWTMSIGLTIGTLIWSEFITADHPAPGPIHITYWEKWTEFEFSAMKTVVDDFNRSQNRIHVDLLSMSGIGDKVMMAVSAGDPPDIAGLEGPNVAQYADDRALMPLDDFCREAGISEEDYVPVFFNIGVYDGHIWALPSTPATTALHYNRSLLRKAGLDPDRPPQTMSELFDDAKRLTTRNKDGSLKVVGFLPSEPGWWNWGWFYVWGGRLWDGHEKITANEPANIRAMEWVRSYSTEFGLTHLQRFTQGFGNFSSPQNPFMTEQVAMELQGVWMRNFVQTYAPHLDWDAAPFPHPDDRPDLANVNFVDTDVLMIPRGCKHPREAFEFIRFTQRQDEMEKLCLGQQKTSPLIKVSDDFWRKHPNHRIRLFYELSKLPNAIPPPKMGLWQEYQSEIGAAYDSISHLSKTPRQALDEVVARMQPRMDQYVERLEKRRRLRM